MNNLNNDYISNIFVFLDDVTLTKTSEVCKKWKETSKIDHIWKYLWKEALSQDPTNKLTVPLGGSYRNDFFQIKKFNSLTRSKRIHLGDMSFLLSECCNEIWLKFNRLIISHTGYHNTFYNIPLDYPSRDEMSCYNYLSRTLTTFQGIGFFSGSKEENSYALQQNLINIVDLTRNYRLSSINIHEALVQNIDVYSSGKYSKDFEIYATCILAVAQKNKLITFSRNGYLIEWDLTDLHKPVFVKAVQLFTNDEDRVESAIKYGHYLIVSFQDKKELKIFSLTDDIKIEEHSIPSPLKTGLLASGKIILSTSKEHIQAYELIDDSLKLVWERKGKDANTFFKWDTNHFQDHPYILQIETIETIKKKVSISTFTVINAIDGKEIFSEKPVVENLLSTTRNTYGAMDNDNYKINADAVIVNNPSEINLWAIPSGSRKKIVNEAHKPSRQLTLHNNQIGSLTSWDGNNFTHLHLHQQDPLFNDTVIDSKASIYQPTKALPSIEKVKEVQNEKLILPPFRRRHFIYLTAINMIFMGSSVMANTLKNTLYVVTLYRLWAPRATPMTFSAKLLDVSYDLIKIVYLPLLLVGQQLSCIAGIISPALGEKGINFFDAKIHLND